MLKSTDMASKLLNLFLNTTSLDAFVDEIALMINNPIYICNVSYKLLSYSKSVKCDDKLWLDMIKLGYYSDEMIRDIVDNYLDLDTQVPNNTPFFRKLALSDHERLVSKLYFDGHYCGLFVILCENEVRESDMETITLMSDIIAKTLATDSRYIQMDSDFYHSVFADLINGDIKNRGLFNNRIMATNLGELSSFLLINISVEKHMKIDDFRQSFQRIFNSSWIFRHNNQFLVVVASSFPIVLTAATLQSLSKLLSHYNFSACISEEFSDLFYLMDHYNRNVRAMEISKVLKMPDTLIEYRKFKFIDMVSIAGKRSTKMDLKQFVDRKVLDIFEYDNMNNTQYLSTLSAYIGCNCSILSTAEKMYVHKNTVTYRIGKIKEIFGLDMNDEEVVFSVFYSCEIMKYYKRIKVEAASFLPSSDKRDYPPPAGSKNER